MTSMRLNPVAETNTWQHCCRCAAICVLLSLLMNASPVAAQMADPALPAFQNSDQAIHHDSKIPSATNNKIFSLNEDQLRYLKFFLAGGILTLLIVLICGLLRSSSTVHGSQPQHYPYPPPPQHFMPPPPTYCYPPAPATAVQPPNSVADVETSSSNAALPTVPHGMYYPSIPLSLSMPVAWPPPAYAAPGSLAETHDHAKAPPAEAQATPPTRSKPEADTLDADASTPNRTGTQAAPENKALSPTEPRSQNTDQTNNLDPDQETLPHDAMEIQNKESFKPNLSPILGEILSHTQRLKNLA